MPSYAPYGNAIYGLTTYGSPPPVHVQTSMSVGPTPTNSTTPTGGLYNSLFVSWIIPGGNWNQMVLVRSSFGVPVSPFASDGTQLLNQISNFNTSFTDTGLAPGRFYYYALYVFDTDINEWLMAASAQGLCLTDFQFPQQFTSWTPDWYMEQDQKLVPAAPLARFFGLLGFEMNWIRSEIETLFTLNSPEYISGAMLPYLAGNVGIDYEPALGMGLSRNIVSQAVQLYKTKGTAPGVQAAAAAYSGYGCVLTVSPNLEIQLDDSTADRTIGHWISKTSNAGVNAVAASIYAVPPQHANYLPIQGNAGLSNGLLTSVNAHGYLPPNNQNVFQLVNHNNQTYITECGSTTATSLGIPVNPTAHYVMSGYFWPRTTLRAFFAQLDWYSSNGSLISSSTGSPVTEIASQWVRCFVAATPPAGAAYVGRTFKSVSTAVNEQHFFDASQLEINTLATPGPTAWSPPRDLQLNLFPYARNLVINGQGFVGTLGFDNGGAGNVITAVSTGPTPTAGPTWPANVTAGFSSSTVSTNSYYVETDFDTPSFLPVNPGQAYSGSWWVLFNYATPSTNNTIQLYVNWFGTANPSQSTFISSSVVAELDTVPNRVWTQITLLDVVAPPGAFYAQLVVQGTSNTSAAVYVAAPSFGPGLNTAYFDGTFSPSPDYAFEGTPNESPSAWYPNVLTRLDRLIEVMPEYTPIGSTFSIFTHANAWANVGLH